MIFLPTIDRWYNRARKLVAKPDAPCLEHLRVAHTKFVQSVVRETEDRTSERVLNIEEYLTLRRDTIAAMVLFALVELRSDIPEEALEHPSLAKLTKGAIDLLALTNVSLNCFPNGTDVLLTTTKKKCIQDLHSYATEFARGLDSHNIITVAMHEHDLDVQAAMDWLGVYIKKVAAEFLADMKEVPSFGEETDKKVKAYIDGLGYWVRGNDCWSIETRRYYGEAGANLEVLKTRVVQMEDRNSKLGHVKNAKHVFS